MEGYIVTKLKVIFCEDDLFIARTVHHPVNIIRNRNNLKLILEMNNYNIEMLLKTLTQTEKRFSVNKQYHIVQ